MKKLLNVIIACAFTFNLASCGGGGGSSSSSSTPSSCSSGSSANSGSSSVTSLIINPITPGTGPLAVTGDSLTVNYTGWLYDSSATNFEGTEFDSSLAAGRQPFTFTLGGNVIAGWNQGLVGVQAGGTYTLTIPSSLGYGSCPAVGSPIPPNSALVFSVTVISITP